jgi:hypothetical protein
VSNHKPHKKIKIELRKWGKGISPPTWYEKYIDQYNIIFKNRISTHHGK